MLGNGCDEGLVNPLILIPYIIKQTPKTCQRTTFYKKKARIFVCFNKKCFLCSDKVKVTYIQ